MKQAYRLIDLITQALDTDDFSGVVGFCSKETFSSETVRMFASCEWVLASSKVFEGTHSLAYSPLGTSQAPGGWPLLREITSRMLDKIYEGITGLILNSGHLAVSDVAVVNPPFIVRAWLVDFLNARTPNLRFAMSRTLGPCLIISLCERPAPGEIVPFNGTPKPVRTRYIRADRGKVLSIFSVGLECDYPILEAISLA